MNQERRSSTFATLKGVGKCMARPLTSEHISAGTLEKGLSSATGCSVAKDSQGAMSFRGTEGPTQVSCYLRLRLFFLLSSPVLTDSHTGKGKTPYLFLTYIYFTSPILSPYLCDLEFVPFAF